MLTAVARCLTGAALLLALAPSPARAQPQAGPAYVTVVADGETLYAELGGRVEAVRYLGVNVPWIDHPIRGREPYAAAAREANRQLVEGKWVRLVFEDQPRDGHGRLLAYVWVDDVFVNAMLIHTGYAEAAPTGGRYGEYFRTLEQGALGDARGLWEDASARSYRRPRPAEGAAAGDYEQRAADGSGGRVFSAPAPFVPLPAASSPAGAPSLGVPSGPTTVPSGGGSLYRPPAGVTRPAGK